MSSPQLFYTILAIFTTVFAETTGTSLNTNDPLLYNVAATEAVGENFSDLNTTPISISVLDSLGVVGELTSGPVISGLTGLAHLADVANGLNRPNRGTLRGTYTNPVQMAGCDIANSPATTASGFVGIPGLSGIASGSAISGLLGDTVTNIADFSIARPIRDVKSEDFICPEVTNGSPVVSKQISYSLPNSAIFGEARLLGTDKAIGSPGSMGMSGDSNAITGSAHATGGELSQAGMYGGTVYPVYSETLPNGLLNPAEIINELTLCNPTHIRSDLTNPVAIIKHGVINSPPPVPDSITSKLMTPHKFIDSKSLLTRLTGINAANLGAKGKFIVKSSSPRVPTGISILADNLIMDGSLAVMGNLPFLASVRVDGTLPDGGIGNVLFSSGNGNINNLNGNPTFMGPMANSLGWGGLNYSHTSGMTNTDYRGL